MRCARHAAVLVADGIAAGDLAASDLAAGDLAASACVLATNRRANARAGLK